ncbi:MAG: ATP-binding protein [Bacteroidota bacterium]|nr:ATP-binding protein [Bacteroidota bacterium]
MEDPLYPRFVQRRIEVELSDTRIVFLCGPRQAGKTTLARQVAGSSMPYITFDDAVTREIALDDPSGFVRRLDRAVIDEVQRVPMILLPLKQSVDEDQRAGRFFLTGSTSLLRASQVADSLAGRMSTLHLWPLAQAEVRGRPSRFLEHTFGGLAPCVSDVRLDDDLVKVVLSGGFPEALRRHEWPRHQSWFDAYLESLLQRDIRDIANIRRMSVMPEALSAVAALSGNLMNYTTLGNAIGVSNVTARTYVGLLEQLFLIQRLRPWHSNRLKRLVRTPKIQFTDAGLLAAQLGISPEKVKIDRRLFGPLLESFVFAELLKCAGWTGEQYRFYHFRDKEGREVDFVIEDRTGGTIGVEVKAAATIRSRDFSGLRHLEMATGARFRQGIVLYDGSRVVSFGDRLIAAPLSALWA